MEMREPLIGVSICAVVLLVLGSFSTVVGYQSVKSTVVNDSPLFSMRTQRATNQQQNSITSRYLGMDRQKLLQFPIQDNKTEQLKKAIEFISKMDDKTFARFTEIFIRNIKQSNTLRDITPTDLLPILRQLRTKSETPNDFVKENNTIEPPSILVISLCGWAPGCLLLCLFYIMIFTVVIVYDSFMGETLCGGTCAAECFKKIDLEDFYYLLNKL
jgi:hypothetical protein